jgi:hypothetical protein
MSTISIQRTDADPAPETHRSGWWGLAVVVLACMGTVAGLDLACRRWAPPVRLMEVGDAVRLFERSDPTVLLIGSSHARTFTVLSRELEARTGGRETIAPIPVEWGKLHAYRWVLEHRLRPIVEKRRRGAGSRLRRFVLVTEWWDSKPPDAAGEYLNLPARAWTFTDFARDVSTHGFTTFNRNYVANQWQRFWSGSSLVHDRGHNRILRGLKGLVREPSASSQRRELERDLASWQHMIDSGHTEMLDPHEMAAFDDILATVKSWGLEPTVVLYPRMPGTVTDRGRATTLATFSRAIAERPSMQGVRLVDYTTSSPLTDAHYSRDFDHVTREGNELFSRWALDGELAFLRGEP